MSSTFAPEDASAAEELRRSFAAAWGSIGASWGIAPSTATVQGYLLVSDGPLSEPEVRRATEAAARRFAELGCEVEAADPGWDDPAPFARVLWYGSMAWRHGERYAERPEWFEPSMAEMIEEGLVNGGELEGEALRVGIGADREDRGRDRGGSGAEDRAGCQRVERELESVSLLDLLFDPGLPVTLPCF